MFGWGKNQFDKRIKRIVRQGGQHRKITDLYKQIREAAIKEYREDNTITVEAFLAECFADSVENKMEKLLK
jgi:hypothetical protein